MEHALVFDAEEVGNAVRGNYPDCPYGFIFEDYPLWGEFCCFPNWASKRSRPRTSICHKPLGAYIKGTERGYVFGQRGRMVALSFKKETKNIFWRTI